MYWVVVVKVLGEIPACTGKPALPEVPPGKQHPSREAPPPLSPPSMTCFGSPLPPIPTLPPPHPPPPSYPPPRPPAQGTRCWKPPKQGPCLLCASPESRVGAKEAGFVKLSGVLWAVSCVGGEWALGFGPWGSGGRETDRESFLISCCGCPCPRAEQKPEKPEAGDRREEKAPSLHGMQ